MRPASAGDTRGGGPPLTKPGDPKACIRGARMMGAPCGVGDRIPWCMPGMCWAINRGSEKEIVLVLAMLSKPLSINSRHSEFEILSLILHFEIGNR